MGDDKAAVEHPLVDFVEQQLREPHRREVFGSTHAQQHTESFSRRRSAGLAAAFSIG
jgi:hypothetical protein